MEFQVQGNGGNCNDCAWVLAQGTIDLGTTENFMSFVAREKPPSNIRFNSEGGNLSEALRLGQYLRASNWDTFVGEEDVMVPGRGGPNYITQASVCFSACVYTFLGGVHRTATDGSIGIHQFYRPVDAMRPNDKRLSAVDLAIMQQTAATLSEYVREMGVDGQLVTKASMITPWEPIYILSRAELKAWNVDNSPTSKKNSAAEWTVEPFGDGAMAVITQLQDGAGRTASLAIMCTTTMPDAIIARFWIQDDTRDWSGFFRTYEQKSESVTILTGSNSIIVDIEKTLGSIRKFEKGAEVSFVLSDAQVANMVRAQNIQVSVHLGGFAWRQIGGLDGTFSMSKAMETIKLARKNCVN